ncbi:hypothetical protein [Romboutsia hominis]|uniref:Uncharacterized protein n=1 Tax=Romboutsia hominis TaxID=1507512 RepID=A0A2P2BRB2_9FIRM|nr:hypothetical protein [Romboutsia hominis]CEI72915.1 Hypothetical protein FRIFI_1380 [Romboutsia hominis]
MKIIFIQNVHIKSSLIVDIKKEINSDIIPRVGDLISDRLYGDVLLDYGPGVVSRVLLDYEENKCIVMLERITVDNDIHNNIANNLIAKAEEFGWYAK